MASSKDKKTGNSPIFADALAQAPEYIAGLYAEQADKHLYFHGFEYCSTLAALVRNAAEELRMNRDVADKLELSGWFHSVGRLFNYEHYLSDSHRLMQEYLTACDIPPSEFPSYEYFKLESDGLEEHIPVEILKDAVTVLRFGLSDYLLPDIFKNEAEEAYGIRYSEQEWNNISYNDLLKNHLCTSWGIRHYGNAYNMALLSLKQNTEKQGQSPIVPKRKRNTGPSSYNFFRITFRNHIELSAMADNRSHIMISVNSILMGVMVSFITYQNVPATNPSLLFPVVIFIITGMTSLIFAILAAKPRMWRNISRQSTDEEILKHLASYSDFSCLSVDEYERKLDILFTNPELVNTNLKKELYHLGKILDIKNRFLVFSYNVFMFGFLVSMLVFLAMLIWT